MRVKKYMARTLPEAVAQVRIDLGPDAVILDTKRTTVGGLFGLFGRPMIQVMAATDTRPVVRPGAEAATADAQLIPEPQFESPAPAEPSPRSATVPTPTPSPVSAPVLDAIMRPVMVAATGGEAQPSPAIMAVRAEFAQVRTVMAELIDRLSLPMEVDRLPPDLKELHGQMLAGGIQPELALQAIGRVRKGQREGVEPEDALRALIEREFGRVQTVGFGRRVVALVGPTGVGKTTTLAKLAAHFTLHRRMNVGLITADTFRIAAVEQLKTYSQIIGVPLAVVHEPSEGAAALHAFRDCDLVLVDTAGRSPLHPEHMADLQAHMEAIAPDETHLVMSLTSGYQEASRIVQQYAPVGAQRLLFTKWDEVAAPGLIYNMVRTTKLPLSYITTGQSVPDDIERADPVKITRAILGG